MYTFNFNMAASNMVRDITSVFFTLAIGFFAGPEFLLADDGSKVSLEKRAELIEAGGVFVKFSSHGNRIVTANDHNVRVWNTENLGAAQTPLHPMSALQRSTSTKTEALSLSLSAEIKVFDVKQNRVLQVLKHLDAVSAVSFAPNAAHLLSGSRDGMLRIWEPKSGLLTRQAKYEGAARFAMYSPNGSMILSINGGTPHLQTIAGVEIDLDFDEAIPSDIVSPAAFSSDNHRFVIAEAKSFRGTISENKSKLVSTCVDPEAYRLYPGWIKSVAICGDGKKVATVANDSCRVWNSDTGQAITDRLANPYLLPDLSPMQHSLAMKSCHNRSTRRTGHLAFFRCQGSAQPRTFGKHSYATVVFSSDGTTVATADRVHNTTIVWAIPQGVK